MHRILAPTFASFLLFAGAPALAQSPPASVDAPIAAALSEASPEVRKFEEHVVTLSNPFMEGRLPGTRGMEIAKEYVEYYLKEAGLAPAFPAADGPHAGAPRSSWRQPFPLGSTLKVTQQALSLVGSDLEFRGGQDFNPLSLGEPGFVSAPVVFVGYSIDAGENGYQSYADEDDLTGKIALMLRFEPMTEDGTSRWVENGWSPRAGFNQKILAAVRRKAAAVILANPPGCADPRSNELNAVGSGRPAAQVPVLMATHQAADRLVRAMDAQGRSLLDLRKLADEGRAILPLEGTLEVQVAMENEPLIGENVGGIIPGRGKLADEFVVIGAHLDHLGMGNFGSRRGPGTLHPGADDNASGSAAVIMLAERLAQDYAKLPNSASARSILLMCFSGEESGLNGARYYVNNPITAIENHDLMVNFDMIGRIENGRLSVSGANTARGLGDWLNKYFEDSPLTIVQPRGMSGASDHSAFMGKSIPVLFAIIADFHDDYHTPDDVSWKINRVGAVHTVDLFQKIALAAALKSDRFEFEAPPRPERRGNTPRRVRFGIVPDFGGGAAEGGGVLLSDVAEDGPAAAAGLQAGDRIIVFGSETVADLRALTDLLARQEPGTKVVVTAIRDGEEKKFEVTLAANDG